MFEDSLFSSGVGRRNRTRTRWIALTSVGLQGLVVGASLVVPLVWPQVLPLVSVAPRVTMIALKKPEVKVEPKPVQVVTTENAVLHAPAAPVMEARGGGILAHGPAIANADDTPSLYHSGLNMTVPTNLGFGPDSGGGAPTVVIGGPAKRSEPLAVSSGVISGLLLAPIQPLYPRIAVAAGVQGTVVVSAVIDKTGRITGLRVLSGPIMLQGAAADAVKEARYRPYLLNGQPTEVVTTISVNFRIGG